MAIPNTRRSRSRVSALVYSSLSGAACVLLKGLGRANGVWDGLDRLIESIAFSRNEPEAHEESAEVKGRL
jgi:hypothetical protein